MITMPKDAFKGPYAMPAEACIGWDPVVKALDPPRPDIEPLVYCKRCLIPARSHPAPT